ncbi:oligoribonuclease [Candidatus Dependentiae bacterium]|nr:oligoribonuclease [Candidatus Dependentiae bacterium]
MKNENNLIWIDLEMTGLDPEKDTILEIGVIVTDGQLNTISEGPDLVIYQPDSVLDNMNDWCKIQHKKSGLTDSIKASNVSIEQAEEQVLEFLKKFCFYKKSPICGNTIYQDRLFLRRYMKKLEDFLHYRQVDVTSFKEVITRWYPENPNVLFEKKDTHRAMEDTRESINELKHYRQYFFK